MLIELVKKFNLVFLGALPIQDKEYFEREKYYWWLSQGFAGDMSYLNRAILNLKSAFPWGRTLLAFAWLYPRIQRKTIKGFGQIANYAVWRDYHRVFKKRLIDLAAFLQSKYVLNKFKAITDAFPILEKRLIASIEGANFFMGKNTLIVHKEFGTYMLLGEIITDMEVSESYSNYGRKLSCGSCSECERNCPTGALNNCILDARKCISYLTIESKGAFNEEQINMVKDWLFGCDICQEVCPFNHKLRYKKYLSFSLSDRRLPSRISLEFLINLTKEQFEFVFSGTPVMRAGYSGMIRNAIAVATNQRFYPIIDKFDELKRRFINSKLSENEVLKIIKTIDNSANYLSKKKRVLNIYHQS